MVQLDHFSGQFFNHWQQKILFFLKTLKLPYILNDDLKLLPKKKSNKSIKAMNERKKRFKDDFFCKGHI